MTISNSITPIGRLEQNLFDNQIFAGAPKVDESAFDQALTAAISLFNNTNEVEKLADIAQIDFATGKNNDILKVVMAEQKAASSLELTVQLTSKAIEAYREIMRIQL